MAAAYTPDVVRLDEFAIEVVRRTIRTLVLFRDKRHMIEDELQVIVSLPRVRCIETPDLATPADRRAAADLWGRP